MRLAPPLAPLPAVGRGRARQRVARGAGPHPVCHPLGTSYAPPRHPLCTCSAQLADEGLLLVNVDVWRKVSRVLGADGALHHYRVQSHFMFRTNISSWPINRERLEIVLESQPEALSAAEGLFFCTMPEYVAASPPPNAAPAPDPAALPPPPRPEACSCTARLGSTHRRYSGLADSIRFPGSIDNQRLSYAAKVEEHCSPPFVKPQRECRADEGETSLLRQSATTSLSTYMDVECECEAVADYLEGYDRESCGCQGGEP